jgi:putative ABC transport system permease protein
MHPRVQDVRHAFRAFFRQPGFTVIAVLALAIGIGANTAIFTVVNAVLVERLPYREAERVVVIWEETARRPGQPNVVGPANFLRWQERATSFDSMAALVDGRNNLTGTGTPEELVVRAVTPNLFPTLGVAPALGRAFAVEEALPGGPSVAILSDALWQRRFAADPAVVGRTIQLNGEPVTVIGVMPDGVTLRLTAGPLVFEQPDVWRPLAFTAEQRRPQSGRYMTAIGRLKAEVPLAAAQAEMREIAASLADEFPQFDTGWTVQLQPIRDALSSTIRPALLFLTGAVVFVLLIACANVASLLLARGAARQREIAIRRALGASRSRIVWQLLSESLVLAATGGLAGLLVALWGLDLLLAVSPVDVAGMANVEISPAVLAFTAAVSVLTAIVAGLVPAFEASRADVQHSLESGARQVGTGVRHRRMREVFVVAEITLAVVLLLGAGLMLRSFIRARSIDPGFQAENVVTARIGLPLTKYPAASQRTRFFEEAARRLTALPGVTAVGAVSFLPLGGGGAATSFTIVGAPEPAPGQSPVADVRVVDNGFFEAMSVPLVSGRLFNPRELNLDARVAIVNETLAREYFSGRTPIGERLQVSMGGPPYVPTEIIGVVGDVRYATLETAARATVYWPHAQLSYPTMTLVVRTASDASSLGLALQREIAAIDRDQPVSDVRTMDVTVARSVAQRRFLAVALSVFAGIALVLAAVGIYGVMSYVVSQRTSEIGLRLALGAERGDVVRMVVANAARLTLAGIVLGVVVALGLSAASSRLLYATSGMDPAALGLAVAVLTFVATLASYLPARRASRIEPVQALRYQ